MSSISPAVQKALNKLEGSLDAGQSYEGHELFKTVFHRFRSRRQIADSYALAEGGALLQLRKGQVNCGTELACMLIDAYTTDLTPASEESVQRVLHMLSAFPTEPQTSEELEPPIDGCSKVASAAIKWLVKVSGVEYAPQIYGSVASYITQCLGWMGLGLAMPQYARSNDFSSFAAAVAAAVKEAHPSEEDLFITQAALEIVAAGPFTSTNAASSNNSIQRAREFLSAYPTAAGHAVPSTPLTHFLNLYLEALEKISSPLVDILLEKYTVTLERDRSFLELIEKSRSKYAPAPQAQMPGLFGNLFRSMMMPGQG